MFTQQVKERDSYGVPIWPASNNGFLKSGTIDMSKFHRVACLGMVGVLGASGSVQAGLMIGNNSNGSDATNFTGGTISTNIAVSNQQFTMEFYYGATELAGARYVTGFLNHITIASLTSLSVFGTECRYPPASNYNDASVNTQLAA